MGDFAYFTTDFSPKIGRTRFSGIALPEGGRYLKRTHVWMDLPLLCQLLHHLNKTIWCRQKNGDVLRGSMFTTPMSGKVDF